ncbi:GAF and ANTAR domain-containing protein [Rhodococcoides kyotonense]|uniref:ANTAR domain-containing protein n=1 Tax=Rhodococcoides kyotonense TaxID=398843 RepID=A0A239LHL8_9NOCA|nr:GAF and ANTAR domain-containing protein [Rhodococcus kyotonensis]SNT29044.1 ANTAR domain-containing protein [Rhodococcus kyotonensis]
MTEEKTGDPQLDALERIVRITERCLTEVDVDGAAVAVLTDDAGERDLLHSTDEAAARIDELQFTTGEGPCLQAFLRGEPELHADIGTSTVWPSFATELTTELNIHSVFAFPLLSGNAKLGVLELYRREPAPLTDEQYAAAERASAALGMAVVVELVTYARSIEEGTFRPSDGPFNLARTDVSIAVGILAATLRVAPEEASARLRARAFAESKPVSDLAHDIVHNQGSLDDDTESA